MNFKNNIKSFLIIAGMIFALPINTHAMTLSEYIAQYNPEGADEIAGAIYQTSAEYGIDPLFMASVFYVESRFHNSAVSSAGAMGIAQLMPGTADYLQVDPSDPYQNIEGGTRYMKEMLDSQNPNSPYRYNLALASYNAGPGNVNGYAPSYTWDYIETIRQEYDKLKAIIDGNPGTWNVPMPNEYPENPEKQRYKKQRPTKRQRLARAIMQLRRERRLERQEKISPENRS